MLPRLTLVIIPPYIHICDYMWLIMLYTWNECYMLIITSIKKYLLEISLPLYPVISQILSWKCILNLWAFFNFIPIITMGLEITLISLTSWLVSMFEVASHQPVLLRPSHDCKSGDELLYRPTYWALLQIGVMWFHLCDTWLWLYDMWAVYQDVMVAFSGIILGSQMLN